ncbi:MAG: hypothetical protein MR769_05940 [Campylobacter sp.]|uniref:hypothetical protein n=1 Tax=Campylobacter sp. TaxID=205 RepID=UPI002AA89D47|nr:hypothetical protein [Campylobacter sp.]MCI6344209.1 hypothetical protein [Campylobacter sp.]
MRIADIKKQNIELKKELDLVKDLIKALESLIATKDARISELVKRQTELSAAVLRQSIELRSANQKLEKRKGFFSRLW